MNKFWSALVNAVSFFLVALFIMAQQDVGGGSLMDGWLGLKYTFVFCVGAAVANILKAMYVTVHGE